MEQLAGMIREALTVVAVDDVELREKYSGRGMYGRECPGITGSMEGCMAVISEVIKAAHMQGDLEFEDIVDTLLDFKQDSMGRDIILYWPELAAFEYEEVQQQGDGQPDEAQEWHDFDPDC